MSIACRGITHCEQCGTPLDMNEFCLCNNCKNKREEEITMSKTYKGYELMKAIAEGKIKEGSKFNTYKGIVYFDGINLRKDDSKGRFFTESIDDLEFSGLKFELIEDEIDIDNIEEVNHYNVISVVKGRTEENINDELELHSLTINELVQAVKQLNKEINSIKEKI